MIKCKYCGEQIPDAAAVCPYCCEPQTKATKVCPYCDEVIDADYTRCPICGEELTDEAERVASDDVQERKNKRPQIEIVTSGAESKTALYVSESHTQKDDDKTEIVAFEKSNKKLYILIVGVIALNIVGILGAFVVRPLFEKDENTVVFTDKYNTNVIEAEFIGLPNDSDDDAEFTEQEQSDENNHSLPKASAISDWSMIVPESFDSDEAYEEWRESKSGWNHYTGNGQIAGDAFTIDVMVAGNQLSGRYKNQTKGVSLDLNGHLYNSMIYLQFGHGSFVSYAVVEQRDNGNYYGTWGRYDKHIEFSIKQQDLTTY